jgi:serine/threonine-protein kinase
MLFQGQNLGKYKILAPLGSGGFGAVYLARDTWIDKDVALKVPHKQNLNFSELLREPRLLAALNHPNIVSITTAEKQENIFFIVMEYVKGKTLDDIIAAQGALDVNLALDYAVQIGQAVDHAHRQGVVHRDLRPPNVLVSDNGVVKVADFGTSRFLEIAAHSTTVTGSPAYMAPEQFDGKVVFASDLYSLGVTMYQMLTGTLPYDAPAPGDLDRLRSGELVKSTRIKRPSIPKRFNAIVMNAMAADLSIRYGKASDLLNDLRISKNLLSGTSDTALTTGSVTSIKEANEAREARNIQERLKAQQTPEAKFCWHCDKPLHARANQCPFCSEIQ